MSDTLIIAGQTYTNVAGFKALDSSSTTQTYIKPSGTKQISISSNGATTENVNSYASAQINVAVPNTYTAGDEGKVVSSGTLVAQGSASYSSNGTYDTTLVSSVEVEVSGIEPSGTKQISITQNGTVTEDVTNYASAEIDVDTPDTLKNYMYLVNNQPIPYGPYEDDELTAIRDFIFYRCSVGITSLRIPNCLRINPQAWYLSNPGPSLVFAPKAVLGTEAFRGVRTLEIIVSKGAQYANSNNVFTQYSGEMLLRIVDLTANSNGIRNQWFLTCVNLNTIILRESAICPLGNTNAFDGTPFASGGTGGTIYIPKSLYDHLGDNSSSDYKAATNWSTINGYGTITWAKIEGSQYDGYYADGTSIPT